MALFCCRGDVCTSIGSLYTNDGPAPNASDSSGPHMAIFQLHHPLYCANYVGPCLRSMKMAKLTGIQTISDKIVYAHGCRMSACERKRQILSSN